VQEPVVFKYAVNVLSRITRQDAIPPTKLKLIQLCTAGLYHKIKPIIRKNKHFGKYFLIARKFRVFYLHVIAYSYIIVVNR